MRSSPSWSGAGTAVWSRAWRRRASRDRSSGLWTSSSRGATCAGPRHRAGRDAGGLPPAALPVPDHARRRGGGAGRRRGGRRDSVERLAPDRDAGRDPEAISEVLARRGSRADAAGPAVLYEALFNVTEQFRALAENASTFMTRLHEAIEAGEVHDRGVPGLQAAVIAYLEEFIGELAAVAPRVAERLRRSKARGGGRGGPADRAGGAGRPGAVRWRARATSRASWRGSGGGSRPGSWANGRRAAHGGAPPRRGQDRHQPDPAGARAPAREAVPAGRPRRRTCSASPSGSTRRTAGDTGPRRRELHRMFDAPSALFSARHLGGVERIRSGRKSRARCARPRAGGERPRSPVAPALRETGRRAMRGRAARVVDYSRGRRELAARTAGGAPSGRRRSRASRARGRCSGSASFLRSTTGELELLLSLLDRLFSVAPDEAGAAA